MNNEIKRTVVLVTCVLILTALAVSVGLAVIGYRATTLPSLLGNQAAHFSAPSLSASAREELQLTEAAMINANRSYIRYLWLGKLCAWCSVLATVAITIIAGSLGISKQQEARWRVSSASKFRVLGFVAAVGSAMTLIGAQIASEAAEQLRRADKLQRLVTTCEQELIDLRDSPTQQDVILRQLRLERDR